MTTSAKKRALGNFRSMIAAKLAVSLIVIGMVYYMIGRPEMYPVWTLLMIGGIGLFTLLSLYGDITEIVG